MTFPKQILIAKDKKYLTTETGERFLWLADTWWYAMTNRMSIDTFETMCKLRKKQGFNVIQCVVGIPPETDLFGIYAKNSGGLPFHKDHSLNEIYFDEVQKKLDILYKHELVPCIFGSWGHHIDVLGVSALQKLWTKIIEIVGEHPAIFSLCGEADLFPSQSRSLWSRIGTSFFSRNKKSLSSRLQNWHRVAEHIKTRDSIHLLTVHIQSRTSARSLFQSPAWLDINSIQSGHSYNSLQFMIDEISKESEKSMPIINLEPWYEGIRDSFYGRDQLVALWACMLSGAAGHSYGAHGIWQMADGDDFQGHWGNSNWNKSMKFEGAKLVGSAVKQIREIWHKQSVSSDLDKLVPDDIMAKISPHMK